MRYKNKSNGAILQFAKPIPDSWLEFYEPYDPEIYTYLDAMNDLSDVQLIDNTIEESEAARAEIVKIIKGLCGVE